MENLEGLHDLMREVLLSAIKELKHPTTSIEFNIADRWFYEKPSDDLFSLYTICSELGLNIHRVRERAYAQAEERTYFNRTPTSGLDGKITDLCSTSSHS